MTTHTRTVAAAETLAQIAISTDATTSIKMESDAAGNVVYRVAARAGFGEEIFSVLADVEAYVAELVVAAATGTTVDEAAAEVIMLIRRKQLERDAANIAAQIAQL